MTNKEKADLFCKEWSEGKEWFSLTTSGSTGTPKTINVHRDQMIASAKKTIKALGLREGMTALICLDVNFIAGRMMVVRSLVAGMKMIVVEPGSNPFGSIQSKIDFAALVPYQVAAARNPELSGKIIIGGAPISAELHQKIKNVEHASCYATFGMTETLSHIALQKLNGYDAQDFFEVLDGVDISLDERQCLVIEADYLKDVVITNDVVELINNKQFRWLGRWDNVINTGGIKVMPEKIESAVGDLLITNRNFISGLPHEQLGQQVVLVIEGTLSRHEEEALMAALRKRLSKYEVPKQILYSNEFVFTSTKKINRSASINNALPRPGL
ncbi:MAG: AMP-binding protein [Bacteroidota bacterium]